MSESVVTCGTGSGEPEPEIPLSSAVLTRMTVLGPLRGRSGGFVLEYGAWKWGELELQLVTRRPPATRSREGSALLRNAFHNPTAIRFRRIQRSGVQRACFSSGRHPGRNPEDSFKSAPNSAAPSLPVSGGARRHLLKRRTQQERNEQ